MRGLRIVLMSAWLTLGLMAADAPRLEQRAPDPPIQGKVLTVHEGEVNTIYCGALMDCSIQAPHGEKFINRSIGDDAHFKDSIDSFPNTYYSIKASFNGFATSLHLVTDHDNQYSFLIKDPGKLPSDFTVILKSGDPAIDKKIAGMATVVSRAEWELEHQARLAAEANAHQAAETTNQRVNQASIATQKSMEARVQTYQFDRGQAKQRPWEIADIYRIGDLVFIKRTNDAQDLPIVNAVGANGKPEIIVPKYDPDRGLFTIAQRINDGYFSFGGQKHEKRLAFHLPEGG